MAKERDTDADWRELGATEPFWGVLSHPQFKVANLTSEGVASFYDSGVGYVADIVERLHRQTGAAPRGRALDFGCGAGRLSEAMVAHVDHVTGYDISPGMLEKARLRGAATYTEVLPEGPFDWINSFIVFQHIPTERGLSLLDQLLDRLAPGGHVSLHVTVWREPHLQPPPLSRLARLRLSVSRALNRVEPGQIMMYDYDLSRVLRVLDAHGVRDIATVSTDHDGHHGVILFGRRAPDATG